jgi:hypothetical protein
MKTLKPQTLLKQEIARRCPGGEWHGNFYTRFVGGFYRTSIVVYGSQSGKDLRYIHPCTVDVVSLDVERSVEYGERLLCDRYRSVVKKVIKSELFEISDILNDDILKDCVFSQLTLFWNEMAEVRACDEFIWQKQARRVAPYFPNLFESAIASSVFTKSWDRWTELEQVAKQLRQATSESDMSESDIRRTSRSLEMMNAYLMGGEGVAMATLERLYLERLSLLTKLSPKQYGDAVQAFRAHC